MARVLVGDHPSALEGLEGHAIGLLGHRVLLERHRLFAFGQACPVQCQQCEKYWEMPHLNNLAVRHMKSPGKPKRRFS